MYHFFKGLGAKCSSTSKSLQGEPQGEKKKGDHAARVLRHMASLALRLLFWSFVVGFALIALAVLTLQIPPVQQRLASRLSRLFSDDSLTISVRRVHLTPTLGLNLRDLLVLDLNRDTLLYASHLHTSLSGIADGGKKVVLGQTVVKELELNLLYDSSGTLNLTRVLRYALPLKSENTPSAKAFRLDIQRIRVVDGVFNMRKIGQTQTPGSLNYKNMSLQALNVDAQHFRSARDSVQMDIKALSCHDHSGLTISELSSKFRICKRSMHFFDFNFTDGASRLAVPSLRMEYTHWKSLGNFIDSVYIESEIDTSSVSTSTLSYFMPLSVAEEITASIAGHFRGSVSDFRLRNFDVRIGEQTHLRLDGDVAGLPKIQDVIANIELETLDTDTRSAMLLARAFSPSLSADYKMLNRINQIHFRGVLTGFFGDFVAYGRLDTDVGSVRMDMGLSLKDKGVTEFNGRLNTIGLQLGRVADNPLLGRLDLTAQTRGVYRPSDGGVSAQVHSRIDRFDFRGHSYRNMLIEGQVAPRGYRGKIEAHDSIVELQFDGMVDFADSVPIFQFDLHVPHANLSAMGVMPPDSVSSVAFTMKSFFHGNKLDNFQGEVRVRDLRYQHSKGVLEMNRVALVAENTPAGGKELRFDSPAVQAKLWGRYRYDSVPAAVHRLLRQHTSALGIDSTELSGPQRAYSPGYTLLVRVNNVNPVLQVVYPRLQLARGSELRAEYDPKSQQLSADMVITQASYGNITMRDVRLAAARKDSVLSVALRAPELHVGGTKLDSTRLNLLIGDSRAKLDLQTAAPQLAQSKAEVHINATLRPAFRGRPPSLALRPNNTHFSIGGQDWYLSNAIIAIDTTAAEVRNFRLYSGQGALSVDGIFSAVATDTVSVGIENIDLSPFSGFIPPERSLAGNVTGTVKLGSILDTVGVALDCGIEDLMLGGAYVGTLKLAGAWHQSDKIVRLQMKNRSYDGREDIAMRLNYDPTAQHFDGMLRMDSWDFSLLRSLTLGAVQSRGGRLNGEIYFSGTPSTPRFDGTLRFDKSKVFVKMLGMSFLTSSQIALSGRKVLFNRFTIDDPSGHPLRLDGQVDLDSLRNPYVSLRAQTDRFQLLHTTQRDNPLYYGNLIATTQADLEGRLKELKLQLRARTEQGTELVFQLPQQSTAKENKYLEFAVSAGDSAAQAAKSHAQAAALQSKSSVGINLQLEITPAALFNIIIDPSTGGAINAHGDGNLQLHIPQGNAPALLYGEYQIQRGEYNFVLGSVLTKKFSILNGSAIQFNGNPIDARLDINAVHEVRTSLDRLVLSDEARYKRRVEVECKIHIGGTARDPELSFGIEVPQADAEVQGLLASALSTDEKKMRQFASLLALGMFFPDSRSSNTTVASASGTQMGNLVISSLSDFLFSQINSWLSSSSGVSIGLGVNYNMADGSNQKLEDETEVSFSMQLDRLGLNIDANWDVSKNNTTSAVAGDVSVSKQSKYVRNLQYKAFARSNDDLVFSDLSPYTAGVGVSYSDSFDSLRELWERVKGAFTRKPKESVAPDAQEGDENQDTAMPLDSTARSNNAVGGHTE